MRNSLQIRLVQGTLWSLFILAVAVSIWTWMLGTPLVIKIFEWRLAGLDLAFNLRFDTLSTLLLMMVTLLGATIGKYSNRYLDGEKQQGYFFRNLLFTLICVGLLITSSNLLMFFLAWFASSLGLHRLLVYFNERPAAVRAARKKFIISRFGDLALLIAIILIYQMFGTLDFSEIFAQVENLNGRVYDEGRLSFIGFLFVFGAMTKSAQFPFHFWLPETMEAPTPVSALMHAGIINAGGFLVIRLSPILQHAEAAHILMLIMGAVTAVFGSLVMITQSHIKSKLAYSTISQMGMMMFACGLSAYSFALFHMIAHSFYKAHAFLSTGQLVEESKKVGVKLVPPSTTMTLIVGLVGFIPLVAAAFWAGGVHLAHVAYATILWLGLMQGFSVKTQVPYSQGVAAFRIGGLLLFAISVFISIEYILNHYLASVVPVVWEPSPWYAPHILATLVAYGLFVMAFWLTGVMLRPRSEWSTRLFFYLWNGGYFSYRTSHLLTKLGWAGR